VKMPSFFNRIPKNYAVLLLGPSGSSKSELSIDFMKHFLDDGDRVVYMITDSSPEKIVKRFSTRNLELKNYASRFVMVDCYTAWAALGKTDGHEWSMDSMPNIKSIRLSLDKAMTRIAPPARIFIDSLSSIFLYNTREDVLEFVRSVCMKMKREGGFAFFVMHDGVHDKTTLDQMRSIVDAIIEMKTDDEARKYIRIVETKPLQGGAGWIPIKVTDTGIVFENTPES
jgi:KaiC/GvpD/RAD55 family RecA-like ATPase